MNIHIQNRLIKSFSQADEYCFKNLDSKKVPIMPLGLVRLYLTRNYLARILLFSKFSVFHKFNYDIMSKIMNLIAYEWHQHPKLNLLFTKELFLLSGYVF